MVKAWEDTILIPTYERGSEDPNPPLLMGRRNPYHAAMKEKLEAAGSQSGRPNEPLKMEKVTIEVK